MQHKHTEPHEPLVELPALWKYLLSHRRTVGFVLSGAVIAAISGAMRAPLLDTQQQPQDSSAPALDLSAKAMAKPSKGIAIDSATQAITLKAIDSN